MKVVYTEEALSGPRRNCQLADRSLPGRGAGRRTTYSACRRTHRTLAGEFAPFVRAPRSSRGVAGALSLQDFLSRRWRYDGDTTYPSRRPAAMG